MPSAIVCYFFGQHIFRRFLKFAHTGEDLDPERLNSLKLKGIDSLWLKREDFIKYADFSKQIATAISGNPTFSINKKAEITRFVRVYRARESFRTNEKFTTWLFTIAANLARNHFRWRTRHPNISLEAESGTTDQTLGSTLPANDPAPSDQALSIERAAAVRGAVRDLPEDLREAIVLCEWEERSVAEAATILETTPKAVESRLYRARQLLRKKLEAWL